MFPPMAIIIPVMIMWSAFRLIDTWYGLVLIYGVITFPFVVWLMKSFFDEVPRELDEAAIVDGSSYWGAFFKVVLPLVKGGLASLLRPRSGTLRWNAHIDGGVIIDPWVSDILGQRGGRRR